MMREKIILQYAIEGASAKLCEACADFAAGVVTSFEQSRKIERIEDTISELKELQQKYKNVTDAENRR